MSTICTEGSPGITTRLHASGCNTTSIASSEQAQSRMDTKCAMLGCRPRGRVASAISAHLSARKHAQDQASPVTGILSSFSCKLYAAFPRDTVFLEAGPLLFCRGGGLPNPTAPIVSELVDHTLWGGAASVGTYACGGRRGVLAQPVALLLERLPSTPLVCVGPMGGETMMQQRELRRCPRHLLRSTVGAQPRLGLPREAQGIDGAVAPSRPACDQFVHSPHVISGLHRVHYQQAWPQGRWLHVPIGRRGVSHRCVQQSMLSLMKIHHELGRHVAIV
mmetsp:Transcript_4483/g.15173  ORF Transcript_4483/g.15173 Transcript_4483/m.15173 type:complete len:277 (+) Transcript_4483:522-1352(+)